MNQLKPARNMRIKNHVTPKGKALNSQLSAKFGITLSDFEKACMGDLSSIQRIGELNKQASFMSEYAPKLKDAYLTIIEGTETYNLALADILKASGSASLRITKAMDQTALADRKYVNGRVEQAKQFLTDKQAENTRHAYQMNFTQIKGYLDAHLVGVERQSAVLEQSNRPEAKQVEADKQYQGRVINEYLDNGNDARVDLIPQKNYRGIKGKFKEFMGALGF
ncbi:hypothetical protein QHH11_15945 [Aphanizomenon sp. PH219]|nr:hypothetical protein [Aphanizomenon sp. PH219]